MKDTFSLELNFTLVLKEIQSAPNDKRLQPIKRQEEDWFLQSFDQVYQNQLMTSMSAVENKSSHQVSQHVPDRSVHSNDGPKTKAKLLLRDDSRQGSTDVLKKDSEDAATVVLPEKVVDSRKPPVLHQGPVAVPRLDLKDAQIQTSIDFTATADLKPSWRAKSQQPLPPLKIQEPTQEELTQMLDTEVEGFSPERLVARQLKNLEEQ